ncbi:MAG: acyl-CoA dehydrogenase family protein, partial [Actinomycetota bacterium]
MDFAWPLELRTLAEEAAAVAADWRAEVPEDTWLIGTSAEFAREMGRRGWLGMTWPVPEGGHGRSALERFVVTEALI